jgi:glutamate carboxypeptidase
MKKLLRVMQKIKMHHKGKFFFICWLLMTQISEAATQEKNAVIQQIVQHVNENTEQQIHFLEKVVNMNSGTYNVKGVRAVGDVFKKEFQALGFTARWVEMPKEMNRAGHLIAEHVGTTGQHILLLGHLDTVFSLDHPFQTFSVRGKTATGPGVIDNKGGNTVILYALKALQESDALKGASITVILTGDEENLGKPAEQSRRLLQNIAQNVDVALEFECSENVGTVTVARRGRSNWVLTVESRADHSYSIFKREKGAIYLAASILDAFYQIFTQEYGVSINPAIIVGGGTASVEHSRGEAFGQGNVTAAKAIIVGDMRYISELQKLNIEKKMQRIVNQQSGESAKLDFQPGKFAIPFTLKNQELLLKFSHISEALGYGKVKASDPLKRGASDLSYVASVVPSNLSGLGVVGSGSHSAEETIDLESLPIVTKRAALLIYELSRGEAY